VKKKLVEIFIAIDGTKFFNSDSCILYENKLKTELENKLADTIIIEQVNLLSSKISLIKDIEYFKDIDEINGFIINLNKVSALIHKKGGLNGGANIIIYPENKNHLILGLPNTRYKCISFNKTLDDKYIYILNSNLLNIETPKKKDLNMIGLIKL